MSLLGIQPIILNVNGMSYTLLRLILFFLVIQLDFIKGSLLTNLFYFACLMFFLFSLRKIKKNDVNRDVVYLLFIWSTFYFISSLLSADLIHGMKIYLNTSLLYFLVFIALISQPTATLVKAYNFLISLCGIFIVIGTFIFFIMDDALVALIASTEFQYERNSQIMGFSGVFINQNKLGPILVLHLSWIIHKLLKGINNNKTFLLSFLLLDLFFLILTVSRASILMFLLFIFIYLILNKSFKHIIYLCLFLLVGVVSFINYLPEVYDFLQYRIEVGGASNRDIIWQDAIQKWIEVPFFGLGPNQYSYLLNDKILSTHNFYIGMLVNTGIFTLFTFLIFLLLAQFKCQIILLRQNNQNRSLIVYCFSIVSSMLAHQFFEAGGFSINSITGFAILLLIAIISNCSKFHSGNFQSESNLTS